MQTPAQKAVFNLRQRVERGARRAPPLWALMTPMEALERLGGIRDFLKAADEAVRLCEAPDVNVRTLNRARTFSDSAYALCADWSKGMPNTGIFRPIAEDITKMLKTKMEAKDDGTESNT